MLAVDEQEAHRNILRTLDLVDHFRAQHGGRVLTILQLAYVGELYLTRNALQGRRHFLRYRTHHLVELVRLDLSLASDGVVDAGNVADDVLGPLLAVKVRVNFMCLAEVSDGFTVALEVLQHGGTVEVEIRIGLLDELLRHHVGLERIFKLLCGQLLMHEEVRHVRISEHVPGLRILHVSLDGRLGKLDRLQIVALLLLEVDWLVAVRAARRELTVNYRELTQDNFVFLIQFEAPLESLLGLLEVALLPEDVA